MSENGSGGKQPEVNAQKDFHFRLDLALAAHKFGMYYRDGSTQVKDMSTVPGTLWTGAGAPTAQQVLDNEDRATNLGFFYFIDTAKYQVHGEAITGLLGRRFPTVFASGTNVMGREHLDQKYLDSFLQGANKMGRHWVAARYDFRNYNAGEDWYGAVNPHKPTTGSSAGSDFTPKFTEINRGFTYLFNPTNT